MYILYVYDKNTACKTLESYRLQTAIFSRETEKKKLEAGLYFHSRLHSLIQFGGKANANSHGFALAN